MNGGVAGAGKNKNSTKLGGGGVLITWVRLVNFTKSQIHFSPKIKKKIIIIKIKPNIQFTYE